MPGEITARVHGLESLADPSVLAAQPPGRGQPGHGIGLGHLGARGADRASAAASEPALVLD